MKFITRALCLVTFVLLCTIIQLNIVYIKQYHERIRRSGFDSHNKQVKTEILRVSGFGGHNKQNEDESLDKLYTHQTLYKSKSRYIFNCSNIHLIKMKHILGSGTYKTTRLGEYEGRKVVVKVRNVGYKSTFAFKCLRENLTSLKDRCFHDQTAYFAKEILVANQLEHPGIVKMLGYCLRDTRFDNKSIVHEEAMISVFEHGNHIDWSEMFTDKVTRRLKFAREFVRIMAYLDHSPFGSVRMDDYEMRHFLIFNDTIKMIDIDSIKYLFMPCQRDIECEIAGNKQWHFDMTCKNNLCVGFNWKYNMHYANELFLKHLLEFSYLSSSLNKLVQPLYSRLQNVSIRPLEAERELDKIIQQVAL